jgi:hypothetical protein
MSSRAGVPTLAREMLALLPRRCVTEAHVSCHVRAKSSSEANEYAVMRVLLQITSLLNNAGDPDRLCHTRVGWQSAGAGGDLSRARR